MSRLGKKPITLPKGVKVTTSGTTVNVEGPKGKLSKKFPEGIAVTVGGDKITFERKGREKPVRAAHGLVRACVANMVKGVSDGFSRTLVSVGVGYRMTVTGTKVNISAGFSHPIIYNLPTGITAKVDDQTKLTLTGADKELLGQVADNIRRIRPPEPYKGKGIRYEGEQIQMKEGKAGAKGGK